MLSAFFFLFYLGHFYLCVLVLVINAFMFQEILALKRRRELDAEIPRFYFLNWYFFAVANFFIFGNWFNGRIKNNAYLKDLSFLSDSHTHMFTSFALYTVGFIVFVLSLKTGLYKYQFKLFAWTHMTIIVITLQSSTMYVNLYDGMIWFFISTGLVIWNDVAAYVCGRTMGKTPLISLSPKKTWEGFIGALVLTIFFAVVLTQILLSFGTYFICKQPDLTLWRPNLDENCLPNETVYPYHFYDQHHPTPAFMRSIPLPSWWRPIHFHALALAVFASLIAPFGGFFASGFKRAFKIKDFADTIPGHGGITDRFDCQITMGMFTWLYRVTFVGSNATTAVCVGVCKLIMDHVNTLTPEQQQQTLHFVKSLSNATTS